MNSNGLLKNTFTILKATLVAFIVSAVLLLIISIILYNVGISETVLRVLIGAVYFISTTVSSIITCKIINNRRIIWGAITGAGFFLILLVFSLIFRGLGNESLGSILLALTMSIAGGIAGAVFA